MNVDICIVNYNTDNLVKKNIDNFIKLNPNLDITFYIGENSKYLYGGDHIVRVEGVDRELARATQKNTKNLNEIGKVKSGNHHAMCLEKCIKQTTSNLVIFLDADFYFLLPLSSIIDVLLTKRLACIGAPYGYIREFSSHQQHTISPVAFLPSSFFTLINKELYTEEIILDARRSNDVFDSWHDKVDTSLPFRETLYKYRYSTFNVCINTNCSICKGLSPVFLQEVIGKFRGGTERFFFQNELCGVHLHYRDSDVQLVEPILTRAISKIYHPLSNFVK